MGLVVAECTDCCTAQLTNQVVVLASCRFVIPLLPRDVTGNLDSLALHSVGVLEVRATWLLNGSSLSGMLC